MKQLKIATLGDYNKYFSYFLYGTMEGVIRCGAWFRPISLFDIPLGLIESQIDFFKPHILFCHCIFNTKPEGWKEKIFDVLRRARKKYGTKVCYHMGDARMEPRYPHDISEFIDIALVNNGELKTWSDVWKIPCYHWPYPCLYQKTIAEVDDRFDAEMVFTGSLGSGHHEGREEFVNRLKKEIKIRTYPDKKWGNSRFLTAEISSSSDAVLGFQMGKDIRYYQDVRPFQYIGAGALYFHDNHPNINVFFEAGKHYVPYGNAEEVINQFKFYEINYKEAEKIRQQGFDFCQKYHSTKKRVQFVIDVVDGKDVKPLIFLKDIKNAA